MMPFPSYIAEGPESVVQSRLHSARRCHSLHVSGEGGMLDTSGRAMKAPLQRSNERSLIGLNFGEGHILSPRSP